MLDANSKGDACLWMRWAGLYLQKGKFLLYFFSIWKKKFPSRRTDALLRHLSQIFMSRELSFFIWMERKWNLTYCARGIKKIKNNLFKQVYTPNFTGKKKQVEECCGLLVVSNIKLKHDIVKKKNQEITLNCYIFPSVSHHP